jgi:hypothetical protein
VKTTTTAKPPAKKPAHDDDDELTRLAMMEIEAEEKAKAAAKSGVKPTSAQAKPLVSSVKKPALNEDDELTRLAMMEIEAEEKAKAAAKAGVKPGVKPTTTPAKPLVSSVKKPALNEDDELTRLAMMEIEAEEKAKAAKSGGAKTTFGTSGTGRGTTAAKPSTPATKSTTPAKPPPPKEDDEEDEEILRMVAEETSKETGIPVEKLLAEMKKKK